MTVDELKILVRQATKIFVWVSLTIDQGVYLQISKKTISEYLNSLFETGLETFLVEVNDFGEVFLGKPPEPGDIIP